GPTVAQEIDDGQPLLKLGVSGCLEHGIDLLSPLAFLFGDLLDHGLDSLLPGLESVRHHVEVAEAVQAGKAAIRSDIAGDGRHPLRDELDRLDGRLAGSVAGVLDRYETKAVIRAGQVAQIGDVIHHRRGMDNDVTAPVQQILILPEELDRQAVLEDQTQQVDEPANLVVSHLEGIGVRDQHAGSRRDPGRQAVLDEEDRLLRKAVFNLFFQVGGRDGDGGRPRHQRLGERKKILRWYPERDREFREVPDQIIEIDQVGDPGRQAKRVQLSKIKTRLPSIEYG